MVILNSIIIQKPKLVVFDYIKFCKNQDHFSVWNMADPKKKTHYEGTDGEVGFKYTWDSTDKNVGAGTQEITEIKNGESVKFRLCFERPMKNVAVAEFVLIEIDKNSTEVSWNFNGPTKFPMSLFSFIFKKILGKDMTKSLENLKAILEK